MPPRGQTSLEYLLILAGAVMMVVLTASVLKATMAPGMENLGNNSTPTLWPSPSVWAGAVPGPLPTPSPSPSPMPISGLCGSASRTYASNATGYGADTFCLAGTANATPAFPAAGTSEHWKCIGSGGGTSASCTATRLPVTTAFSACGTISSPGYYVLTGNLSGSDCVRIASDNVTLDCQGYTIGGGGDSIRLLDASWCTVKNCRIADARWAISLVSSDNVKCNHNTIYNNTIRSSGHGIVLDAADWNNISSNRLTDIQIHGIDLYKSATAAYACDYNTIEYNQVNRSGGNIDLQDSYWTIIRNNVAYDATGSSGILVSQYNVAHTEISNNWACSNSPKDIKCDSNNNVTGSGNTCTKNTCPDVVCSSDCGTVNGACGTANGYYSAAAPTGTGLCSSGAASSVSGSGPWSWYCNGSGGGTTASCATVNATYVVLSFTTVGNASWTAPAGITSIDYLVVGGGGGGGAGDGCAGGGGGGGARSAIGYAVVPGNSYAVVVGAGGAGGPSQRTSGSAGGASSFNNIGAAGGGGGAAGYNAVAGGPGGSGGGGGWGYGAGGAGNTPSTTPAQGYNGGYAGAYAAGGGGGAGGPGYTAAGNLTSSTGGAGGPGVTSSINGSAVTYGGGGGGAGGYTDPGLGGAGGAGGGGAGATSNMGVAIAGTNGLGGGGGGSSNGYTPYVGKNGGSGAVIIRYANNSWPG
jgi:parallel beta-helix repeat protein